MPLNIRGDFLIRQLSLSMSALDTLNIRGLLPFSGEILIVLLAGSRSVHSSLIASPGLAPVSFNSWRKVPVRALHAEIS